jgi:hypothetical protein
MSFSCGASTASSLLCVLNIADILSPSSERRQIPLPRRCLDRQRCLLLPPGGERTAKLVVQKYYKTSN